MLVLGLALALLQDPRPAMDEFLRGQAGRGWSGAVLVARAGEPLLLSGYGFADFETGRANDGDTLFEVASLTKSFTAVAVVQLAQRGKLALDDALAVHVPGVPGHSRAITLRHLLAHTAGIPRANAQGSGEELTRAMLDYLGDGPVREPGARFEYWNGGYALLAGVIESVGGAPYPDWMEREVLVPAGMTRSGFTGDEGLDAQRVAVGRAQEGSDRRASEPPYRVYDFRYKGMGGLVTSARELLAFERALAGGLLLDAEHTRELFTPQRDGYALGWNVGRAADGSARQFHRGSVRGFTCEFRRYPERDACVAVLCNTDDARPSELADALEQLLLGRGKPKAAGNELLPADEEALCAGTYGGAAGRLVVRAAPGVLMASVEGLELLARLGADEELAWKADPEACARRAVEIVEALARGDTGPLRATMAKRIPERWPDDMRRTYWPAQLAKHGAFRGVFPLGTRARDGRLEVLLALEHEQRTSHASIAFGPAGLERLEWDAPAFLASGRLTRLRRGTFELALSGEPQKLEFALAEGGAREVRIGSLRLARQ